MDHQHDYDGCVLVPGGQHMLSVVRDSEHIDAVDYKLNWVILNISCICREQIEGLVFAQYFVEMKVIVRPPFI